MSTTDGRDNVDAPAPGSGLRGYVRRELRNHELALRVAAPCTVVAYDPATQIAQCTVGYLQVQSVDTPGVGEVEVPLRPDVVNARVAVVQGATHSDHVPIAPGDTGLLVFLDRALDTWLAQTTPAPPAPIPMDPIDGRAHDMADAVFIPGLAPDDFRAAPPSNPLARTIEAPVIALGAGAADAPLLGTSINTALAPARSALFGTPVSASPDPATVTAVAANKTAILAIIDALAANVSTKVVIE